MCFVPSVVLVGWGPILCLLLPHSLQHIIPTGFRRPPGETMTSHSRTMDQHLLVLSSSIPFKYCLKGLARLSQKMPLSPALDKARCPCSSILPAKNLTVTAAWLHPGHHPSERLMGTLGTQLRVRRDTGREVVVLCELEMKMDLGRSQTDGKKQFGLQGGIRDSSFAGGDIQAESKSLCGISVGKERLNVWGKRGEQMDGPAILSESDHERLVGSVGDRKSQRAWKVLDPKDTRALRVGMT